MKTLVKRNKTLIRWLIIVIVCYLLASAGVNQVINPCYYFQAGQIAELPFSTDEDSVRIDVSAHADAEGFLTIKVDDMNTFNVSVKSRITYENGETEEKTIDIGNAINCYKLQKLGKGITQMTIPQTALKEAEIQIGGVEWSPKRQCNVLQMMRVFISLLGLVIFYRFMQWIKKKYTV